MTTKFRPRLEGFEDRALPAPITLGTSEVLNYAADNRPVSIELPGIGVAHAYMESLHGTARLTVLKPDTGEAVYQQDFPGYADGNVAAGNIDGRAGDDLLVTVHQGEEGGAALVMPWNDDTRAFEEIRRMYPFGKGYTLPAIHPALIDTDGDDVIDVYGFGRGNRIVPDGMSRETVVKFFGLEGNELSRSVTHGGQVHQGVYLLPVDVDGRGDKLLAVPNAVSNTAILYDTELVHGQLTELARYDIYPGEVRGVNPSVLEFNGVPGDTLIAFGSRTPGGEVVLTEPYGGNRQVLNLPIPPQHDATRGFWIAAQPGDAQGRQHAITAVPFRSERGEGLAQRFEVFGPALPTAPPVVPPTVPPVVPPVVPPTVPPAWTGEASLDWSNPGTPAIAPEPRTDAKVFEGIALIVTEDIAETHVVEFVVETATTFDGADVNLVITTGQFETYVASANGVLQNGSVILSHGLSGLIAGNHTATLYVSPDSDTPRGTEASVRVRGMVIDGQEAVILGDPLERTLRLGAATSPPPVVPPAVPPTVPPPAVPPAWSGTTSLDYFDPGTVAYSPAPRADVPVFENIQWIVTEDVAEEHLIELVVETSGGDANGSDVNLVITKGEFQTYVASAYGVIENGTVILSDGLAPLAADNYNATVYVAFDEDTVPGTEVTVSLRGMTIDGTEATVIGDPLMRTLVLGGATGGGENGGGGGGAATGDGIATGTNDGDVLLLTDEDQLFWTGTLFGGQDVTQMVFEQSRDASLSYSLVIINTHTNAAVTFGEDTDGNTDVRFEVSATLDSNQHYRAEVFAARNGTPSAGAVNLELLEVAGTEQYSLAGELIALGMI